MMDKTAERFFLKLYAQGLIRIRRDGSVFDVELGKVFSATSGGYIHLIKNNHRIMAHRFIWTALRGPIPNGHIVDHKDGCRSNNRIGNLRPVTESKNRLLAIARGHADKRPNASLTPKQVRYYRKKWQCKELSIIAISRETGLSRNSVSKMLRCITYNDSVYAKAA